MKLQYCLYLFVFFFFFPKEIFAQEKPFAFNLVTGSKDILIGKVTGITQDKWGYMWFVDQTNNSLIRYDGYRMKAFKNNPSDTTSINVSGFECIAADSLGNIWFPAEGGVDKLSSSTGIATHYKLKFEVGAILVDHLGYVWLGGNVLCRLNPKTGISNYYVHDGHDSTTLSNGDIRVLYEDHEGTIWVGSGFPFAPGNDGGLNKFNRTTGKFTRYLHDPDNPHSIINNRVRAILEDSRGTFWVGTQGDGLQIMDRKTGIFDRLTYDPAHPEKLSRPPVKKGDLSDHITFINEDLSGNIWIGTYHEGIVRYDPLTKKITHFISDKITPNGFNDSTTWCGFTSRDGTLWVATEDSKLLYRIDAFRKYVNTEHTGDPANTFLEDKEEYLWVGTGGSGIFKFDQHQNLIQHLKHDPPDSSSLPDDRTSVQLMPGQEDEILATTFRGLRILDMHTNKFSRFNDNKIFKDSAQNGFVDHIRDRQGLSWFTRWGLGLIKYNPKDNSTKQFLSDPEDTTSLSSNHLNHIIEDKAGRLWIGSDAGLNRLNPQTGKFKHYFAQNFIGSVYQDSRNNIWAGTAKGLYRYDEDKDIFSTFLDPYSELSSIPIGGIIEDNNQNLWFNSNSAIIKLNPLTKQVFIYRDKFGIEKNSMAVWTMPHKDKNGQLFFGYHDGFVRFYPQEIAVKTGLNITVTSLFINTVPVVPGKQNVLKKPIEETGDLDLKYNQTNIAFNFSAMDYRDPESIRYFTMLEGYDNIWREAKDDKSSYYFNLPRGKYIYRIKAIDKDGTEAQKIIRVIINPPWWQTWWAYTFYALLLIAAVWSFTKWRTKILKKEKIFLEKKVTERTQELKKEKEIVESTLLELKSTQTQLIQSEKMASLGELTAGIAHEIQNPLNFVNNFSEVNKELLIELKNEIDKGNIAEAKTIADDVIQNEQKINHHGRRADGIVKGMLQHSRASSGQKELTNINALADEYLRLSYHGFRAKDKSFNATIKTDFDSSIDKIKVVPQDMGRVLLNLYNNAFYAVAEKSKQQSEDYEPVVFVSTKKTGDKIELMVKDNGNGIPQKVIDKIFQPFFTTKPTGQGTGLGLSLSYDIIKTHGGEIKVESKEGEGSTFIIELPVI